MLDAKEIVVPTDMFAGEGIGALLVAAGFLLIAVVTVVWLRGPGSRQYDPPVARDRVFFFAVGLAIFAAGWAVRAVWGFGGFLVASALALVALGLAAVARRRVRRS